MSEYTSIREALEDVRQVQDGLNLIAADLLQEDKRYGEQILKLSQMLDDVVIVMTVEANIHDMARAGK